MSFAPAGDSIHTPEPGAGPAALAPASAGDARDVRRGDVMRRFARNRLAVLGLLVVIGLVFVAFFAPLLSPHDPNTIHPGLARARPSARHWFGGDYIGRDLYTRILFGSRVSLRVGLIAVVVASSIGLVAGAIAGFYGRWIDSLLMRITDVFLAFPYILAAIAIISALGRGERAVTLVLGVLGWMPIARIFRSSILQIKQADYIEAARALGARNLRIIVRHMLPNAIQPVIVYATIFVGTAVLSEAALSFLGLGISEPTPSWGAMVNQGRGYLFSTPLVLFFPAMAIFTTVMAFVFVGDGLRDAIDPKLR